MTGEFTTVQNWRTNISELMSIFRAALVVLVPVMERAHIRCWGETYDDWDRIAEALYESIVNDSIRSAQPISNATQILLPKYDFRYDDYSELSFVSVAGLEATDRQFAFVAFDSQHTAFDVVKAREITHDGDVVCDVQFDTQAVRFQLCIRGEDKGPRIIEDLSVLI